MMSIAEKSNIKVHVLNFHHVWSHIEIVLENTSVQPSTYYCVNRWSSPYFEWHEAKGYFAVDKIAEANSTYSFDIEADPQQITDSWRAYYFSTNKEASVLGDNCAVAAQWFLSEFANIPKPNLRNLSVNHLALGILCLAFFLVL